MNRSDKRRNLWLERENNNLCIYCGKNDPIDTKKGCEICLDKKVKATIRFTNNNKEKVAQYRLLIKHTVIDKYGGKCNCCGEDEILFLTIDHINNDGKNDRFINGSTNSFYLKLRRDDKRDDLQVLCFNCNLAKQINGGICPHMQIVKKLDSSISDKRHIPQFDTRLKIVWPIDDELIKMCNESSINQVAKSLGVDFSSVSGRLKRRGKYELVKKYGQKNVKINKIIK